MTAFGYIFIDPEKKYLLPISKQQYMIEEYGRSLGHQVKNFFVEQYVSARTPFVEREEAAALLQSCRPNDLIIATRVDFVFCRAGEGVRLIRMLYEQSVSMHLVDMGGDIVRPAERKLVISTGISAVFFNLLESLAEREKPVYGAAIRRAKKIGKKTGRYLGGPVAFGYKINEDGFLEEDQPQQDIISQIIKLRKDRRSYRDIAKFVSEKFGTSFSHEGIRKILARQEKKKKKYNAV
jgi:DNA invertase Pin-like site-specific DNA recombinase